MRISSTPHSSRLVLAAGHDGQQTQCKVSIFKPTPSRALKKAERRKILYFFRNFFSRGKPVELLLS
jgi:hypothetical protein